MPKRSTASGAMAVTRPPVRTTTTASTLPAPKASDRKSTRLNSSHLGISYAVFCLKKKKITMHLAPNGPRARPGGPCATPRPARPRTTAPRSARRRRTLRHPRGRRGRRPRARAHAPRPRELAVRIGPATLLVSSPFWYRLVRRTRFGSVPGGGLVVAKTGRFVTATVAVRAPSIFFFNDTATTEIYTLSLHDALPISSPEQLVRIANLPFPNQDPVLGVNGALQRYWS